MNERSIEKTLVNTLVSGALIAGAVSGCVPSRNIEEHENTHTPIVSPTEAIFEPEETTFPFSTYTLYPEPISTYTPVPNPLSTYTPYSEPTVTDSVPIEEVALEVSSPEFNEKILEFTGWKEYELESVERVKPGYTVITSQDTPLFMIPLRKDNFLNDKDDIKVKQMVVPADSRFEIGEIRTIRDQDNREIRLGIAANTFGEHSASVILLSGKDENKQIEEFAKESVEEDRTVSYIVSEEHIYPNKVINTLVALKNISQYQDENGPFTSGQEYSYVNMAGINDNMRNLEFAVGLTSNKLEVKGGGVCAMATAISTLVHISDKGNMNILEQWAHPSRYAQGPFSPSEFVVDATVGLNPVYDFRWVQEETKYLNIDVQVSPSEVPFDQTAFNGVGGLSDVNLIVSISFTDTPPVNQSEEIQSILDNYRLFRESKHDLPMSEEKKDIEISRYNVNENINTVDLMYNVEDSIDFAKYNIEELENIQKLRDAVNNFPDDSEVGLNVYLQTTDWYKGFVNEENKAYVDRILENAASTWIEGQPLQCVGFAMVVSWLYPELQIPYVGGGPESARELIPADLRSEKWTGIASSFSGMSGSIAMAGDISLDGYLPSDLYVRTDGGRMASTGKPTGHVGLILDKRTDEYGNTILLVADSNRLGDGRIRIFEVDQWNVDEIFGEGQRYILRYSK